LNHLNKQKTKNKKKEGETQLFFSRDKTPLVIKIEMNKNNPTDPTMNTFTTEKTYTLYDICVENVGGWREGVLRFNEYLLVEGTLDYIKDKWDGRLTKEEMKMVFEQVEWGFIWNIEKDTIKHEDDDESEEEEEEEEEKEQEPPKCVDCDNIASINEYYPNGDHKEKYWTLCEECFKKDQEEE
jgi:hypothetical protein